MYTSVRPSFRLCRPCLRRLQSTSTSSTTSSKAPPLLQKLRTDLKTAMRARDTNRLNVLRGILSDVTNASKSSKPISSDIQMLGVLRKRTQAAKDAAEQFAAGGRKDLKDNEDQQRGVLEEYAGGVETVSEDEIRTRVGEVVNELAVGDKEQALNKGAVIKKLLGPGGVFEGKAVEKKDVVKMVDLALGTK